MNIKHSLVDSAIFLCRITRIYRILCPFYRGSGVILAMHRVLPSSKRPRIGANSRIEVTPDFLQEMILFFRHIGYEIISLDDMHQRITSNDKGKRPFVCFTFDDGYSDIIEHALPIFERHNVPFAVYIITSFADQTALLWWYMIEDLILGTADNIKFTLNHRHYSIPTSTFEDKEAAYNLIRDILMAIPQDHISQAADAIFTPYGIDAGDYKSQMLDWKQVMYLAHHPLATVGAHTLHHYNLKKLPLSQVRMEIQESKQKIEQRTGVRVMHFAYPFGSREEVGQREFAEVKACGFKTAVTIREGTIFPEHRSYMYCLPRIEITGRYQSITLVDMRRCGAVSLARNGLKRVITD